MRLFVLTVSVAFLSIFSAVGVDCYDSTDSSGEIAGAYEPPPSPPNPDPPPPPPPPDFTKK
ncbi:MAG TPA: hypothetical protein VLJ60_03780 [bacterium]|jgi:hypothetical protein|nr:hypothetical protein [bacterium]